MELSKAARRRQLANLYQVGNEDNLLRRHRPKRAACKPTPSRCCMGKTIVRREKEEALYGCIAETVQFGQRRAWHYGYQNRANLSGSGPLAAASRYGAKGTLRMVRRQVSASRGGAAKDDGAFQEGFRVDEWGPMLRCSTSPSLATMTTPKAWPESAMYPHGSHPKRLQPSPWYDGETTGNDVRPSTAGPGMRRAAASHGFTMSILRRNASLENTNADLATRTGSSSAGLTARSPAVEGGGEGLDAKRAHVRTPKRMDQETGYLSGGALYTTAHQKPLTRGWKSALDGKMTRQTEEDGLKWSLLKQILKVVTVSQNGVPLEAVKEVAAGFGRAVGTSRLATKSQFTTHITGKHVGFPQSELITLFAFFQRTARVHAGTTPVPTAATAASSREKTKGGITQGVRQAKFRAPPSRRTGVKCGSGGGGGSGRGDVGAVHGADWVDAVSCLRLLAKPKEPVLSAILGVFEVFARSAGDRARCARRLEQERVETEKKQELKEERERWKRRRRREQEGRGTLAEIIAGPKNHSVTVAAPVPTPLKGGSGSGGGGGNNGGGEDDGRLNRASLAETARMFTLVCSNQQERHAVTTTYRHRFRLELQAVMQERRNPNRFKFRGTRGGVDPSPSSPAGAAVEPAAAGGRGGGSVSRPECASGSLSKPEVHFSEAGASPTGQLAETVIDSSAVAIDSSAVTQKQSPVAIVAGVEAAVPQQREGGVTVEEFSEALVRCPEMLEVFGNQLAARLRHRHRPAWMAPILRKGG